MHFFIVVFEVPDTQIPVDRCTFLSVVYLMYGCNRNIDVSLLARKSHI